VSSVPSCLFSCPSTFQHGMIQWEYLHLDARSWILEILASRSMRNNLLFIINYPISGILSQSYKID
jgi:hypothetical protein